MSKKLIKNMALLVALLALCLTAAFSASAATENGYTYTVTDGKATITAVDSTVTGDVVIPDTLGGYPVTEIGGIRNDPWEDSDWIIGAFEKCTGLTSVTIPESVTSISHRAFANCTGLTKIYWNAKNVSLEGVNDDCSVFTNAGTATDGIEVVFGDTVESIPDFTFCGCDMGSFAYNANVNIKSVTIGNSVKSIGDYAFYGCAGLTRINWNAESVSDFTNEYDEHYNAFYKAGSAVDGIEVVFGDNVKRVPAYAFFVDDSSYSPKIKTVTIGNSVTSIGEYAFKNCTCLTSVTFGNGISSIGESVFENCTELTNITIPESVTSITDQAFANCTGLTNINWNAKNVRLKDVPSISDYCSVFTNAGTATEGIEVVFGDTVESIPDFAFCRSGFGDAYNANVNIKSVTIGNSVKSIGKYAFYSCAGLTNVTIPDSVTSIGSSAFAGTAWLDAQPYGDVYAGKVYYTYKGTMPENTSIVIKDGTKGIAGEAFYDKRNLVEITIPDSVTNIGNSSFRNCSFKNITIPDSVQSIGNYAFSDCDSISRIEIPGNVKTIGDGAFEYCSDLQYIFIEDGVEKIGDVAFCHASIKQIVIPDSVTEIGSGAFSFCGSLSGVTIGNGIEVIEGGAFNDCPNLTEIKLGRNIKTIEEDAFTGLLNFPEVYFAGSEAEWQAVSVHNSNDMLLRGNMHYNADISHDHFYNEEIVRQATCTEDGETLYICDCGKVSHREVIPASHSYCIDDVVEPTCTEDGYTWYYCTRCDDSYKDDFVPARGYHVPGAWIYETGSCTEGGTRYKECVDCGEIVESEDVEPTEHTVVTDPATPATCTTSGLSEGSHCSVCGEVLAEQEYIPATGHTEVFTEYVEPTCTEDGKTVGKVCSVCGEVIIPAVTIPARGHHYTEWIVTANPTCTVDGKQIKICACGLYEEESIPAAGHADADGDGVCDNCLCVTDGTQQGEEEKPNSFFARIREFFAKLIEMLKNLFK